jgi:hypothetical protein
MPIGHSRRMARFNLLQKSAIEVAKLFSDRVETDTKVIGAIVLTPRDDVFHTIVNAYDREVDQFKRFHGYREGQRINSSKIAGLLIRVMVRDGIDDVFVIPNPGLRDSGLDVHAGLYFVWHVACAILMIDQKKLPPDTRRDFTAAISTYDDVAPELICFAMANFQAAFGEPAMTLQD